MKTFAFALCILVLALTIQDISARPRGRGPQGQRAQGQRGQGQGQRGQGQGQRGQGQGVQGQGQRGEQGRRRGGPKFSKLVCQVQNATTLEVVCDNSSKCPAFAECSPPPAGVPQPPPISGLLIQMCIPKVCDPADPAACPTNSTCIPAPEGIESRCIPDFRPRRRHSSSSSEESSESEESFEEEEEVDVEEEEKESEEDDDFETCGELVKKAIREEVRNRGQGQGGIGGLGQGQGDINGFGQGRRINRQGQNGPPARVFGQRRGRSQQ